MNSAGFSPEIQKRIDALPEDVRKLVYSADMDTVVQEIGRRHSLHIDQLEALEAEVAAAMIGITELADFTENVADTLNLDQQKSTAVAKDVNDMLFSKIREAMKKVGPEKSVVMPSSLAARPSMPQPPAAPAPAASAPLPTPPKLPVATALPAIPTTPAVPVPQKPPAQAPNMHPADVILTEKTVQVAPPAPTPAPGAKPEAPKSQPYKTDPYREPIE